LERLEFSGRFIVRSEVKGTAFIAVSSMFFAAMAVTARILSKSLSAGQLSGTRFVVGIVAVTGFLFLTKRRLEIRRPMFWASRGLIGGFSAYLYFVSIEHLDVGPATLLNNTSPAFTSVFAYFFLRERMGPHAVMGMVLSMAGAALVGYGTGTPTHPFALGIGFWAGMASAVLSGCAVTIMRSLRRDTDAMTIFYSFCVFGFLWSAPMAIHDWRPLEIGLLAPALLMGVFSLIAQLLYTHGLGFVPAGSGSAVALLVPALSWTVGIFWLGESASALSLFGAALTLLGAFWGSIAAPYLAERAPKVATVVFGPGCTLARGP
jgi:drug/metabolite transporter (DMT)-like permease